MTRHPRAATPAPTVPPPLAEPAARAPTEPVVDRLEPTAKRAATLRALGGLAVALLVAGGSAAIYAHGLVRTEQLDQVRTGASTALTTAQAGTSAQLGALQATVQDLRTHQATNDATLQALAGDVQRLNGTADLLYLQLIEISRVTGARQVPAATATSSPTPRPP